MENLLLINIKKTFGLISLQNASKLAVRELEQSEGGLYMCFVDDKKDSFDVQIKVGQKREILLHTCDCGNTKTEFCIHQLAAMQAIKAKEKNIAKKPKKTTKIHPTQELLNQVDEAQLKEWVREILLQNKDIQMAFLLQFSHRPQTIYTITDVEKITKDVISSVIKKTRKTIEASELKKIVDLWTIAHKPIMAQILQHLDNPDFIVLLKSISESCMVFYQTIYTNSNKVEKYVERLWNEVSTRLVELPLAHFEAANEAIIKVEMDSTYIYPYFFQFIDSVVPTLNLDKRQRMTQAILNQSNIDIDSRTSLTPEFTRLLFNLLTTSEMFEKYQSLCKPIYYDNAFNIRLINALVNCENDELAERYCLEIIKGNTREEYNVPYWKILKTINNIYDK